MNKKEFYIFMILIAIFSIAIAPKVFQNDTFFTIPCGQNILENGINKIDNLTWHENLEFTNDRWIFDVIITWIYNSFGFFGIYVFVMIFSLLIGVTFYCLLVKRNINVFLSFCATICILHFGSPIFAARAQIVSILLFIIESYAIEKLLETNKKIYSIILIVIPLIIANVHASIFPVCFIFYLPYIAEAILDKILLSRKEEKLIIQKRKYIKSMIIVMIIGLATGLFTPIGLAPYTSMFKAAGGISSTIIAELQPLVPIRDISFSIIIIIFVAILAFTKTKMNMADFFMFLGLTLMSLSTSRTKFYLFFVGSVSIIKLINQFFIEYKIYEISIKKMYEKILYSFIIVIICINSTNMLVRNIIKDYVDIAEYPVDACNYILKNIDLENMKIYNGFNYGSYLEFKGIKSFIDSRSGMFCDEFNEGVTILEDFNKISSGEKNYNKIFDEYEITHALLYVNEMTSNYLENDEEWKLLYQDDSFVFYERINQK